MSVAGRDGLIEDMARRHLKILQAQINGLGDGLMAERQEFLKRYPLAQRCAWEPPPQGKWKWAALERGQKLGS